MLFNKNLLIVALIFVLLNTSFSNENFFAYHTKVSHSSTDYMGKYADLIVVLGPGRQREGRRAGKCRKGG